MLIAGFLGDTIGSRSHAPEIDNRVRIRALGKPGDQRLNLTADLPGIADAKIESKMAEPEGRYHQSLLEGPYPERRYDAPRLGRTRLVSPNRTADQQHATQQIAGVERENATIILATKSKFSRVDFADDVGVGFRRLWPPAELCDRRPSRYPQGVHEAPDAWRARPYPPGLERADHENRPEVPSDYYRLEPSAPRKAHSVRSTGISFR